MSEKLSQVTEDILNERFGHDSLIALATVSDGRPYVRTVNALYENGSFYVVTYALSGKMKQINACSQVAVCGDWFTAQGVGENLGHILASENASATHKMRAALGKWYGNGHVDESDPNTCILRIRLTEGVLLSDGTRYEIDFTE